MPYYKKEKHFYNGIDFISDNTINEDNELRTTFNTINNSSYFSNLLSNIGNNQTRSTCGYVALAMLLSYYDNVLNNSIVNSSYEVNGTNGESNGTLFEPNTWLPSPDDVPSYYNYIRNYSSTSLHSYLILVDKNALLMNPPNNQMASTYQLEFGTTTYTLRNLVNSYLLSQSINQYCTVAYNDSYYTSSTVNQVVNEIKTEINNNRPVLCGFDGHARIVYGYSLGTTTHFLCHEGYLSQSYIDNYAPTNGGFDTYGNPINVGYISLHFSFPS